MGWRRARHTCIRPFFWFLRADGRIWDCPECESVWVVKSDRLGKVFVLVKRGDQ